MAVRKGSAVWNGTLKEGNGELNFGSFKGAYSFTSRFEEGEGTNPEELIAAAHAGCFSMALSADLGRAGYEAESIETTAHVHLVKGEAGLSINKIELVTRAKVPNIDEATFMEYANATKENCIVSRALAAVETVTLDATLES